MTVTNFPMHLRKPLLDLLAAGGTRGSRRQPSADRWASGNWPMQCALTLTS